MPPKIPVACPVRKAIVTFPGFQLWRARGHSNNADNTERRKRNVREEEDTNNARNYHDVPEEPEEPPTRHGMIAKPQGIVVAIIAEWRRQRGGGNKN